jgi:hypothetical protein
LISRSLNGGHWRGSRSKVSYTSSGNLSSGQYGCRVLCWHESRAERYLQLALWFESNRDDPEDSPVGPDGDSVGERVEDDAGLHRPTD